MIYVNIHFYILYMLYRLIIYIRLTNVKSGGFKMILKKRYYNREIESEDDISIYSRDTRELLLDDDELTPVEDAFMNGYEEAG